MAYSQEEADREIKKRMHKIELDHAYAVLKNLYEQLDNLNYRIKRQEITVRQLENLVK